MSGGAVIIIDPNKVVTHLDAQEAARVLREAADALDAGDIQPESPED